MSYTDKRELEAIYEAQLIFNRINAESYLLEEGFFDSIASGVKKIGSGAAGTLNLGEWFVKALPYIGRVGLTLVGVNLISKVLEFLGKRADSVSDEDAQKMYKLAPPEIQQRFDELAQLKETDPEAYQAGVKQIRDYAMRDLKDKLEAKGVKVEGSFLGKTLSKIGNFGNSFLGTIIITGGIFAIMHFLGIYSPPSFVNKTLGDRAADIYNKATDVTPVAKEFKQAGNIYDDATSNIIGQSNIDAGLLTTQRARVEGLGMGKWDPKAYNNFLNALKISDVGKHNEILKAENALRELYNNRSTVPGADISKVDNQIEAARQNLLKLYNSAKTSVK